MKEVREKAFDQGALVTLLTESHRDSYRDSSLEVRRRYRKLIAALTQAKQVVAAEVPTHEQTTGSS